MLMVIGPDDSSLFEYGKSLKGDSAHLSQQLMLYSSLDLLDDVLWTTGDFLLPAFDRAFDGKYFVSAYVGFAPVKLLLMQAQEPNKNTRQFLNEAYELCVRYLLNPFSYPKNSFRSTLEEKLRRVYERYF
ncbi:trafficking protein particle complex 2 [Trypanosoma theileri]|uniref:Trafficking protein particle complex 2 n=1 Tax=Trypanosoma theileri TaxID=67003 RepID=A0A1X0NX06_9TRYP|nr:trafficking protein particle complex 2 [Trypanosoma theileri]XP_028884738.1 trafficking protein particle complex 2 [Trypanosoma theileri]ORC89246.1 trafficking protein particle complex 2 [Trypanosoma theileri]ORC90672.1 trafficking protein particle complex 2 [Trypanosoma theileri]